MISEPIERYKYFSLRLEKTAEALRKHGFESVVVENADLAREFFFSRLRDGMSVGFGGSRTLVELQLLDTLRSMKNISLLDRTGAGISKEQKGEVERRCFSADIFIASANALCENGVVVNMDKWGNRTAAIEFGPHKVYLFVGRNKLVPNLETAIFRVQNEAAVMNCIRFGSKTPCVGDGKCHDCNSSDRICSTLSVVMRSSPAERICVVLVNSDLGF